MMAKEVTKEPVKPGLLDAQVKTENQEPENSALEARKKAADAARIKSQVRVQPAKT